MTASETGDSTKDPAELAMHNARRVYMDGVGMVLWSFQLVEESLKTYLDITFDVIRARTKGTIVWKWSRKDVERLPLGPLVSEFEMVVDDAALISELRALQEDRNHCAHKAYLVSKHKDSADNLLAEAQRVEVLKARVEAVGERLMTRLRELGEKAGRESV